MCNCVIQAVVYVKDKNYEFISNQFDKYSTIILSNCNKNSLKLLEIK